MNLLNTRAIVLFGCLLSLLSPAATRTWVGGQPGNSWHDPANWDAGVVPGPADEIIVPQENAILEITADATASTLSLTPGASIVAVGPNARIRVAGSVIVDGAVLRSEDGGQVDLPQADRFEAGLVAIRGPGSVALPNLRLFDHSSVELTDGAFWAIPSGVTNMLFEPYRGTARGGPIQVSGQGSRFDGSSLRALTLMPGGGAGKNDGANVRVLNGGEVDLSRLFRLTVLSHNVALATVAVSSNSLLRLDSLEFIGGSGGGPGFEFQVAVPILDLPSLEEIAMMAVFNLPTKGLLRLPKLLRAAHSVFRIPEGSSVEAGLLADFTTGAFELSGSGQIQAPSLRNVDHSRFAVTGGAHLELPARITSYFWDGEQLHPYAKTTSALFSATGDSSRISAPGLETITVNNSVHLLHPSVDARKSALVELPSLQRITANLRAYFDNKGTFELHATELGEIAIPKLAEVLGSGPCGHVNCSTRGIVFNLSSPLTELAVLEDIRIPSEFYLPTNGVFRLPTSELVNARVMVPPGARFEAPLLTQFRAGTLSLSGAATFAADNLSDLSGTHIALRAGARYRIPDAITQLDTSLVTSEWYPELDWLLAEGPGSLLDGRSLLSLKGSGSVKAINAGTIDLSSMVVIDSVNGGALDLATSDGGIVPLDSLREVKGPGVGLGTRFWPDGDLVLPVLGSVNCGAFNMQAGKRLDLPALTNLAHVLLPIRIDSRVVAPLLGSASYSQIDMDRFSTLQVGSLHLIQGHLTGVGSIEGNLINQGNIQPGNPFGEPYGTLTVTGDFLQLPNQAAPREVPGTLLIVVGGRTAKGLLDVKGQATLGGRVEVKLRDNYDPRAGVTNEIARWAGATGGFWSLTGAGYGPEREFQLDYAPSSLRLVSASAAAPTVLSMAPAGQAPRPLGFFDVAFSEVLDPSSFASSALRLLGPDGLSLATEAPLQVGQVIWRIPFAAQTNAGLYQVTILPSIRDAAGNPMSSPFVHHVEVQPSDVEPGAPASIARDNADLVVQFQGTLESAPAIIGPWSPIPGATSPYRLPPDATARFFRSWR